MHDADVRTVFSRLLETEPDTPDLGPYVGKARNDTRRRRWAVAGASTATGAVLVAAVLVAPTVVASWTTQPASNSPAAGSGQAVPTDPQEAHAARLTTTLQDSEAQWLPDGAELTEVVADWPPGTRVRPGAGDGSYALTFSFRPTKSAFRHKEFNTEEDVEKYLQAKADGVAYEAMALVLRSGRVSQLRVTVEAVAPGVPSCRELTAAGTCESSQTANGDTLLVTNEPGGTAEWKLRIVRLARQDGTYITVDEHTDRTGPPGLPADGEFALTIDQLTKIALLPEFVYSYQP